MSVAAPPETRIMKYSEAFALALAEEMRRDDTVFIMGQDVATMGGTFGAQKGLLDEFGADRVRNTAINEAFMVGAGVGAAIAGMRPVVDLVFSDFGVIAGDEIYHKAAKWRYMHGGRFTVPIVINMPMGLTGGTGAEHSASLEVLGMHFPGLKVAIPSTPADAKGLLKTAIRDPNPVIFHPLHGLVFKSGPVPIDPDFTVPFGEAVIRREGSTVSAITYGAATYTCLSAAEELAKEGIDLEVIDLRTLVPLDVETILRSVSKTNRAIVVHDACRTAGPGAELAARIQEEAFFDLEAPILRVAGADVPIPQDGDLEKLCVPNPGDVASAARRLMVV